ncbi:ATP-binding protein [Caenimonas soli]|uniref:ATP-binding protein n=1 Tax=Caenimonas soli TaxID=2735555 RepID=UPI001557756D|nr:ATP-binding protein [Caenimonas soli]NPC54540.1 PAS domain-containing protein [Caenimonas soli]
MALDRETRPGTSRMHAYMSEFDWSASSFGEPLSWPKSLCTVVDLMLDSAFPMCLAWGPELRLIYNDGYLSLIGHKHPAAFGAPMREVFAEVWPEIGPIAYRTVEGQSCYFENFPAETVRHGRPSQGWFTFSYTPVRDDEGSIGGLICIATETTTQVEMERRHAFQLQLSDHLRRLSDPDEIIGVASRMLGLHLKVARVGYLEVDAAERQVKVRHDWSQGELPPLSGRTLDLDNFGPMATAVLKAGRTLRVDDSQTDERSAPYAHTYTAIGARSLLAIPLIKNGRWRAVLRLHRAATHVWTDDEVTLAEDVAERTWAAIERAHSDERRRMAEEELQHNAALQAFRLELSDMLRPLTDPDAIIALASSLLGHQLGASRVLYAEVDDVNGTFDVRRDWTDEGVVSVAGNINRLEEFGTDVIAALRAGTVLTVDDVSKDERTAAFAQTYARVGVRAFLALPLVKSGRLSIVLMVQQQEPCRWRAVDLQRAQDMAERTWSYVETARAQAALRAERDQSQYVFDSMTEGFAMLDPDCRLLQMNAEGLRIGKLSAPEVIGRRVWEIWPKVVGSGLSDLYHRVRETGKGASVEYRTNGGDEVSWLEVRAYPALNGGLAVFYRDINERKQAEEKLKEADRRKDEFLAMLAHELRNPLAPIAAAAELLSIEGLNSEDVQHTSEVISRQVSHMTSLVNDLLDMSRVTSGLVTLVRAPMDIKSIMAEAIEQVEPLIRSRDHHLAVLPAPVPALVWGDHKRLVQVLANLLNNAVKYTPPGGNIVLKVEALEGYVGLSVRDNGIGMSPELVESAFELFAQAQRTSDRADGGLGIGLALVRGIVELHGGTVTAHSDGLGLGSEFRVLLPRAGEIAPAVEKPGQSLAAQAGAAELKVLIVDDNVDAAQMLGMLLKVSGQRVFVEHLPKHALELARAAQPDVCLLDIGLPEMDGNELARRLRAQPETAGSVLIAVTGYSQENGRPSPIASEFDHHMVKPIETGRLLTLLRHISSQRNEAVD